MFFPIVNRLKYWFSKCYREYSHGEMIERVIEGRARQLGGCPVLVETGSGISTLALSECARNLGVVAYSLDSDAKKVDALIAKAGDKLGNIQFLIGDSLENLPKLVNKHSINFLFLDSGASAIHTFREFLICEPALKPGASLLIDNCAAPEQKFLLSGVRKGRIIIHYLLASPYWEVRFHPRSGDSMVSAFRHENPAYGDSRYALEGNTDDWRQQFNNFFKAH